jgi:hypothetical protein
VPHRLSDIQKLYRVTLSQELPSVLERQEARSWHDIVTLDESSFYLNTDPELSSPRPEEEIPGRERQTVQSQNVMLTIVWNPSGFHVIRVLPKGFKFNATYYTIQILGPLSDWRRIHIGRANRKLLVHSDNEPPHIAKLTLEFLEHNSMKRAPHSAYSPGLAPSDFYLFGYVKQRRSGSAFPGVGSLLQAVNDMLEGIEEVTLEGVFRHWMEGVRRCSGMIGEYEESRIILLE